MQLRSSLAAVNSSSAPPTIKVSLAELAAPTPGNEKVSSKEATLRSQIQWATGKTWDRRGHVLNQTWEHYYGLKKSDIWRCVQISDRYEKGINDDHQGLYSFFFFLIRYVYRKPMDGNNRPPRLCATFTSHILDSLEFLITTLGTSGEAEKYRQRGWNQEQPLGLKGNAPELEWITVKLKPSLF